MGSEQPLHVVIIPFMAQGHTLPLLDLSKLLARRGIRVTLITTTANFQSIFSEVSKSPEISVSVIPFPRVEGLPEGVENTADLPSEDLRGPFIEATKKLREPFEEILRGMFETGCPPICVISDFFLGWTLDSCNSFGVPRVVSHGMSALSLAILSLSGLHASYIRASSPSDPIQFPELSPPFQMRRGDFKHLERDPNNPMIKIVEELVEKDSKSWGLLINSFEYIEREYTPALESFFGKEMKAWCVGPLLLCDHIDEEESKKPQDGNQSSNPYIAWLNKQDGHGTVIYVSFGSEARLSDEQLDEIALALEIANHPFIWVVKSKTWVAAEGWEKRVTGRGLILRSWVEQRRILEHSKIGGFLSHCGWNSVSESLSVGVPLLAWPMGADQPFNAKIAAEWLGAGIRITHEIGEGSKTIRSEIICKKIEELMVGEKGRKARERAQELKRMARQAMKHGGSSDRNLNELIERLTHRKKDI